VVRVRCHLIAYCIKDVPERDGDAGLDLRQKSRPGPSAEDGEDGLAQGRGDVHRPGVAAHVSRAGGDQADKGFDRRLALAIHSTAAPFCSPMRARTWRSDSLSGSEPIRRNRRDRCEAHLESTRAHRSGTQSRIAV